MPKTIKDVDLVKKDQERMRALVAWTEIVPNLSVTDKSSLISFGQRYGMVAMVKRARSMLINRNLVPVSYIEKIKAKTDFLVGMHSIWRSSSKPKKISQAAVVAHKKRAEFVKSFAKRSEPLIRSMLNLAFTRKVVEVYLNRQEIDALTGAAHTPADVIKFKSLIEGRSGQTIDRLMKDIQVEIENDFTQMWAANIKDGLTLASNPEYAKKYQKALESGNIAELANFYMKGNL